ncbi:MAG: DUF3383 family protein [Spirochaetes bacterium]|nr:DUF3383 family protein [Spirochaetota bacterium]
MPYINDLTISIILQTLALQQQGFGIPLILGERTSPSELIGDYGEFSDLTSMIAAGFTTDDPEYKMAAKMLAQSPCPEKIAVYIRDDTDTIPEALAELIVSHNNWYALLITERDKTSLAAAGGWAASNKKLFFGCSTDLTALTDRNVNREAYLIHTDAANYPEAAWVGLCLPQEIGSITWKWKRPTGVIASTFNLTELNQIRTGNGQTMSERSGVVYTDEGITTAGEYIDVIQARDYIEARLGEELFALQVKSGKIPYDNTGFARIESVIRAVLNECGNRGIIARVVDEADREKSDDGIYMYTVAVPARSEIPANDRAARKLTGITFTLTIAGAVHNVAITGYIEV